MKTIFVLSFLPATSDFSTEFPQAHASRDDFKSLHTLTQQMAEICLDERSRIRKTTVKS